MHAAAPTQYAPANPVVADSSEQHTFPFEQSSGPSQVIAAGRQFDPHIPNRFIVVVEGQQGPLETVQMVPSQATSAPTAIVGGAQPA